MDSDPGSVGAASGDRAGWPSLSGELLRGLVHELRGRAMTLGAVRQILDSETRHPDLLNELSREVKRLEETVEIAALLAERPGLGEEPLSTPDAVRQAVEIWSTASRRAGQVVLADEGSAPPILVDWALLRRVLLLAVDMVESSAKGASGALTLTVSGGPDSAEIRVEPASGGEAARGAVSAVENSARPRLHALAETVGELSGALTWTWPEGGGLDIKIRLPSLSSRRGE